MSQVTTQSPTVKDLLDYLRKSDLFEEWQDFILAKFVIDKLKKNEVVWSVDNNGRLNGAALFSIEPSAIYLDAIYITGSCNKIMTKMLLCACRVHNIPLDGSYVIYGEREKQGKKIIINLPINKNLIKHLNIYG